MTRPIVFVAGLVLFLIACKGTKVPQSELQLSSDQKVIYLDSSAAAQTVIIDDTEQFFKHITRVDMAIQMQRNFPETTPREDIVSAYKTYLQEDVVSFNSTEKTFISGVFKEMMTLCEQVNPTIFPTELWLIKSSGRPYGPSTYYTRENGVVIPKQALEQENHQAFLKVMIHELFHVYSRLNPAKRKELYERIGFKKCGRLEDLQMLPGLKNRVLLNPDGVDIAYAIELNSPEGETVRAIPIIVSNETQYSNDKKQFFAYLHFDLYSIEAPYSRLVKVNSDTKGYNQLGMTRWPDFHRQIGTNTNYIIHPDEILADNFMHLLMSKRDTNYINTFDVPGRQLIQDIEAILVQ